MPSRSVNMENGTAVVFTVPDNRIAKIRSIEVLNGSTSDVIITVQDVFTPSPTINNPSPSEIVEDRKYIKVLAGDDVSLDNQDIEILRTCQVTSSVNSSDIKVCISWEYVV